jgi:putative hydrolase of HD superfamily
MSPSDETNILKYFFEAGMLKRTARSGWWSESIKQPESVADHSFRAAIIAFVLAKMEGADPQKLCTAAVFHDMQEARLGDMNKITARYIEVTEDLEGKVEREQVAGLSAGLRDAILNTRNLSEKELAILKDADYLECAIQAKEYADAGNKGTMRWVENIGKKLRTQSAKTLHSKLGTQDSNSWWEGLKKLD